MSTRLGAMATVRAIRSGVCNISMEPAALLQGLLSIVRGKSGEMSLVQTLVLVLCCAASHAFEEGRHDEDATYPFCGGAVHNGSPVRTLNANAHGATQLPKGIRGLAMCNNTDFQVKPDHEPHSRQGCENPNPLGDCACLVASPKPCAGCFEHCALKPLALSCALHTLTCGPAFIPRQP